MEQRYEIQSLRKTGKTLEAIGKIIGKDKSSVSRELKRNSDGRSGQYRATLAQRKCLERHGAKPKHARFAATVKDSVEHYLSLDHSPEQISGHCKKNGIPCVSPERIYQHIWDEKRKGGSLHLHLRRRGRKNKKRGAAYGGRGCIPDRMGIEKRPAIVGDKKRFGDLEIDTIIGKNHKGALLTINDRASGMLKMKKTMTREAAEISAAANELLEDWVPFLETITSDNGKEFAGHKTIAQTSQVDFYFANPYHSWERGANENLNGLVRQYFPKKTDFSTITDIEVKRVEEILNTRPRKRFNFENPIQRMDKLLFNNEVAFIT